MLHDRVFYGEFVYGFKKPVLFVCSPSTIYRKNLSVLHIGVPFILLSHLWRWCLTAGLWDNRIFFQWNPKEPQKNLTDVIAAACLYLKRYCLFWLYCNTNLGNTSRLFLFEFHSGTNNRFNRVYTRSPKYW